MENIFNNPIIIENITNIIASGFVAFLISFLITPWVGKLAYFTKAIDIPPKFRSKSDKSLASRINEGTKPRLGGVSMLIAIFVTLLLSNLVFEFNQNISVSSIGIILGILIIGFIGFLDDKYDIPGIYQLIGHMASAAVLIYFGISLPDKINFLNFSIDLNTFSKIFEVGGLTYEFVFPSHFLTLIWVVLIINFINWVGGVDGLNISLSSIISFTMLLFALSASNIPLAILISIHIGSNLGLLPYNYYPSHIIPGSVGDFLNGYLIAVFAILGDTRWTITIIVLSIPLIDALFVIWTRIKLHPEVFRNPFKILSISDTNHLHHRLMALGFSRKTVLLIEITLISFLCSVAVIFGINPNDSGDKLLIAFAISVTFLLILFTAVSFQKERIVKKSRIVKVSTEGKGSAVVKVILEDEQDEEDSERFSY